MILIKMLGFLLGLCTLILLSSYIKNKQIYNETSKKSKKIIEIENFENVPQVIDLSVVPFKDKNYFIISKFVNNISLGDQKWYDDNVIIDKTTIGYNNDNLYFTFDKLIKNVANNANNGISPANINEITLSGPQSLYFANNNNYELSECSIFLTLKFNDLVDTKNNHNILLEILANTNAVDEGNYLPVSISIIILNNADDTSTINIIVGDVIYTHDELTNIKNNITTNIDVNLIGLIISTTKIIFYFNNNSYIFNNTYSNKIILGTSPIIINKDGALDLSFYNFIYYKNPLSLADIQLIKNYNNYYISGKYNCDRTNKKLLEDTNTLIALKEKEIADLRKKNHEMKITKIIKMENKCPKHIENKNLSFFNIDPLILKLNPRKTLQDIFDTYFIKNDFIFG
jgi:hypothetical protein